MSLMTSIASIIKEPLKNKSLIKMIFTSIALVLIIFTLIYAGDVVRVLLIVAGALYLFSTEALPVHITALLIMVVLMTFGLVTPQEGVSGFSNSATITVMAMFVLSAAIQRTGIIYTLGRYVFNFAGKSEIRQLLAISLIIGPISGIINNTAAVAIMLPMVLDLSKRAKTSATKLLIPLSFVSMAGGMLTLIGTSTNILASSTLVNLGFPAIEMFTFTRLGLIILLITIFYFVIFGHWLLPSRKNIAGDEEEDLVESDFLVEIMIEKGSRLIGKSLKSTKFLEKHDLKLMKIIRGEQVFIKEALTKKLEENDIIALFADEQRLIELDRNEKDGIKLLLDFDETRRRFPAGKGEIVKVLVRSLGKFHQRSLSEIGFWRKYGAAVVGVHRTETPNKRLADMKLKTGEILLIKSSKTVLAEIKKSSDFVLIEYIQEEFNREKMWTAMAIVVGVIAVAALGYMPIMVSALAGIILMVLTKCIEPRDLYDAVSWDVIFLLAGVIPLGIAMQTSGTAEILANSLAGAAQYISPYFLLLLVYVLTTSLTEIVSNNASVVLIIPVVISVAEKLSLNPMAFVLAVMFAASTSFLTPIGYQTNTMVYGAGNYKFSDFIRVGAPLNIILAITTTILIVQFWGL